MVKNLSRRIVKMLDFQLTKMRCLSLAAVLFPAISHPLVPTTSPIAKSHTVAVGRTGFSYADSARLNDLYDQLQLENLGLSADAYHKAIAGFLTLVMSGQVRNPGVLSIIDFSRPSTEKRLFVLDMYNGAVLFNTLVAHGRNSGKLLATRFSNRVNSLMSSLGFYLTGDAFMGQHGYSLRLEGKEKGWNDNAFHRCIIMHPADYVSEEHIEQYGYLGRSEGCPAIPEELDRPVIDSIRGGSCLFIYSPNSRYLHQSGVMMAG
ncbi:MAG TPA: murein L,D-transpeptidase catalytic domain family protein [Puia sp.]|jgi:hypothetical protein